MDEDAAVLGDSDGACCGAKDACQQVNDVPAPPIPKARSVLRQRGPHLSASGDEEDPRVTFPPGKDHTSSLDTQISFHQPTETLECLCREGWELGFDGFISPLD